MLANFNLFQFSAATLEKGQLEQTQKKIVEIMRSQELITRSVKLPCFLATAFSQVRLVLDTPFPL